MSKPPSKRSKTTIQSQADARQKKSSGQRRRVVRPLSDEQKRILAGKLTTSFTTVELSDQTSQIGEDKVPLRKVTAKEMESLTKYFKDQGFIVKQSEKSATKIVAFRRITEETTSNELGSSANKILPSSSLEGTKDVDQLSLRPHAELWNAVLEAESVPLAARPALLAKFRIEIASATRPKWVGRLERGGELAILTAPLFLKRVHADDIAPDGTVYNEIIRAIDPDLMKAVELYISKRRARGLDLGDAKGLNFILARPAMSASARRDRTTEPGQP